MRYLFLISWGLLLSLRCSATNKPDPEPWQAEIDSLTDLLVYRNSSQEAHSICQIGATYYRNAHFEEGLEYAEEALKIGRELGDEAVIIRALRLYADIYYSLALYPQSIDFFNQELSYHEKRGDRQKIAEVFCNLGLNYEVRGLLEKGMEYYLKAIELYEQVDDKEGLVATYCNMAYVFRSQGKVMEAIDLFRKAAAIEKEFLEEKKEYYFLVEIADSQMSLGYPDSARHNLLLAESLLRKLTLPDDDDYHIWIDCSRIQADILCNQGKFIEAREKYLEALGMCRKIKYIEKEGIVVASLGTMLIEAQKFAEAKKYLLLGQKIAEETGTFYLKRDIYLGLSRIAEQEKRYQDALQYFRKSTLASDSVLNIETARQLADMQVKYQTEKKEDQIRFLTQEQEIQNLHLQKSENQKIYLAIMAFLFLGLAGLTFNRFRLKQRSSLLLAEKNRELSILNATKDKFFAIIAHDLKNPVSAFHTIAGQIETYFDTLSGDELKEYLRELSSASSSLHALLKNLLEWSRSQRNQLNMLSVATSTRQIVEKAVDETGSYARAQNIELITNYREGQNFKNDEHILVTVLRNLITNAVKFSPGGSQVSVEAEIRDETLYLQVADQGRGISAQDLDKLFRIDVDTKSIGTPDRKGTGLGLIICRELLEKIGGSIRAESILQKGSKFIVQVPLKPDEIVPNTNQSG